MVPLVRFAPPEVALAPLEVAHFAACRGQVMVVWGGNKFGAPCSEVVNSASFGISVGASIVSLMVTALLGSNFPLLLPVCGVFHFT